MNFKEKISIFYTDLTTTEKRICANILKNPKIITEHSIVEAGNLCNTSKSAMLRFAKKLEYSGYSEFKYAIKEYYSSQKDYPKKINDNTLASQIILNFKKTVDQLANLNLDDKLKELSELIDKYQYVKALGIGNSSFCANQLVYSLYSYDKFFDAVTDDVQFSYLKNCLNENYLLIIFSVSGSPTTYLELLKEAKKKNAYVVLITMNNETQLAKYSNMTFYLPSTISYLQDKKILKQFDNRTTLHFFSEVISYYYGFYIENKKA